MTYTVKSWRLPKVKISALNWDICMIIRLNTKFFRTRKELAYANAHECLSTQQIALVCGRLKEVPPVCDEVLKAFVRTCHFLQIFNMLNNFVHEWMLSPRVRVRDRSLFMAGVGLKRKCFKAKNVSNPTSFLPKTFLPHFLIQGEKIFYPSKLPTIL